MNRFQALSVGWMVGLHPRFRAGLQARFMAGFTTLELLVVIAILGISASLAIPGFSNWLHGYRLKGAARDLYSNLHFAKSWAIRDRGEWAVEFNAAGNTYQVVSGGPDRLYSTAGDNVVLKTVSLAAYGSSLSYGPGSATRKVGQNEPIADSVSFPGDRVVFNSRGMTSGTLGGYAYITNDRNACFAVGTWSSGIVVLKKWNGSAWE
jgi:prepilin-type N-terminal cleavage/methylation domain-containing protein